jgi:hypothetical protein
MSRWYRAYEGTVTDAKLGEAALVAGCTRSVAIAAWHCILESCATAQRGGEYDTSPRRVAVILGETVDTITAVFDAFVELDMIGNGAVTAWKQRQFESDTSTERSRRHRQRKCNADATLQQRDATPPYTETDTDSGRVSAREPLADLEHKLREAAGWQSEPAPMLAVTGEVQALIENGADLETDVLPVVKALAPKCGNRTSWRYFLGAIARQRDQRIAASTIVSPPSSITGFTHAATRQKPTRSDIFAAINARIDAAERGGFAEGDGDDGIALEGAA